MATVYLALGSNVGNPEENLRRAVTLLGPAGAQVKRTSSFYETEPVDFLDQAWFLNAVLEAETEMAPLALLHSLRGIETTMGSQKAFAKGPRLIDLDMLLYDGQVIDTPELQIPHPRMLQRKFVLVPLVEIAPDLRHPSWSATARELLAATNDRSAVRKSSSKRGAVD